MNNKDNVDCIMRLGECKNRKTVFFYIIMFYGVGNGYEVYIVLYARAYILI